MNLSQNRRENRTRQCIIRALAIEEDHPQQSSGKVLSNCTLNYGRHRQQTLHVHGHKDCPDTSRVCRACLPGSLKHRTSWQLVQYTNPCQCSVTRTAQRSACFNMSQEQGTTLFMKITDSKLQAWSDRGTGAFPLTASRNHWDECSLTRVPSLPSIKILI